MKIKQGINKGNLFVIAAPSGAGKTSLTQALVGTVPGLTLSISHTTRKQRPHEVEGINYFFVDQPTFKKLIKEKAFLEHATIFDHLYGTSKQAVEDTLQKGIDVILEIDWQGYRQIKKIFPDAMGIFILPPSLDDLQDRLTNRRQDSISVIKKRLADAKETISHVKEFDYVVMNDEFSRALNDLKTIVEAARLLERKQTIQYAEVLNRFAELDC